MQIKFTRPHSIPKKLFETIDEFKIAFTRAFYDDEGSVSNGKIYLTQKSKNILLQIKSLLNSLGINSGRILKGVTGYRFVILTKSYERFFL